MPPRIRVSSVHPATPCTTPQARPPFQHRPSPSARPFSQTSCQSTRLRKDLHEWLNGPGAAFRDPLPGSTNYLGAYGKDGRLLRAKAPNKKPKESSDPEASDGLENAEEKGEAELAPPSLEDLSPFPLNRQFRSQSVLSEALREEIWRQVVHEGKSIRAVSSKMGVTLERVGAVVRLKTIEKQWAESYSKAVLAMLPQTPLKLQDQPLHESINDLPVHPATRKQLFYPTSESRRFTREDAGRAFDPDLLPADDLIPHPEMIQNVKERNLPKEQQIALKKMRAEAEIRAKEDKEAQRGKWEKENVKVVQVEGAKADFRFTAIKVEDAGKNGRDAKGTGWRYGVPFDDRKRGQLKVPNGGTAQESGQHARMPVQYGIRMGQSSHWNALEGVTAASSGARASA
ncbi:hypothetical protein K402DRAFT_452618 [Aulographum hederae CBS 113979]|uniref:Eukaryotic mitochondrial regulator protein-domain-containing protein n=1 Tax=Aulographum hederae CBS 113979 TaxID=1176131 RepID=A0A6G1H7A1_9PEZI|nr:hypothetical protein K402DRAFT_452618 [Aulographum hederae CBS 113979]